ncbi:phosphoribosyltransferase family protein [Stenotrophomonas sp. RG-453]|uniref:phosphoribosyltransferase family protein n=1 Tax=Stenotrophomonas sp. RG-453 TaxID=2957502 RepID=UPI0029CA51C8|nr:phosphoribosyltransferase family protein [Stenotrophomonas sp. RG-453]MDX5515714.1 hypothetical protein [Stenotrophomonas sp. RG-453]
MNYRSIDDLSRTISLHLHEVPQDTEIVVGIPRSGMLPASIIALKLNIPLTDIHSFIRNDELKTGSTRNYKLKKLSRPADARKILLVDDSVASGSSMKEAIKLLSEFKERGGTVVTLAIYAERAHRTCVDKHFEVVNQPRMFEWNIMHHPRLSEACLDIDGVLCVDPGEDENDDGRNYLHFVQNARPLIIPTTQVKHLVTSRLEKYRKPTEEWLSRNGVRYRTLHMLDLPTAEERRRLNMHHKFKASIYGSDPEATLFIESEPEQAKEIMLATGKPVYCTGDNLLYTPQMSIRSTTAKVRHFSSSLIRRSQRKIKNYLSRAFNSLRSHQ